MPTTYSNYLWHIFFLVDHMIEIERKFLVNTDTFKIESVKQIPIIQAYLNTHPERSVRIRVRGDKAILTVKGKGNSAGTSRFEWEKEISLTDAKALLPLCEKGQINKTRYEIPIGNHVFEVDEFYDDNKGLIIAEVELQSEDEFFEKPGWLGKEVTGEKRYYNSQLILNPYINW